MKLNYEIRQAIKKMWGKIMGIIFNRNVEETEIMSAYGLTAYGRINRYEWTLRNNESEKCLISIRIADRNGNDVFKMNLGNNCILWSRVDDTLDNFLYWIATENPDKYEIEKQVYKSLCSLNCLFNHRILNAKLKERKKEEEQKRIAEREEKERKQLKELGSYCKEKGLFYYVEYGEVTIIETMDNHTRQMLAEKCENNKQMKLWIELLEKHPEFHGARVIKHGSMEEVLKGIK